MSIREPLGSQRPIFILGILQRCGTNFLHDLLCLHPETSRIRPIFEDYFTAHSEHLVRYVSSVRHSWDQIKPLEAGVSGDLLCALGQGLTDLLCSMAQPGRRIVTKTPSVENLDNFFKIFPDALLLILVRDGRAVVESGVRSFGWSYEETAQKWKTAARRIRDFDRKNKNAGLRYLILRYEDLVSDLKEEMTKILRFTGLDPARYDFEAALNLPVRGSSGARDPDGWVHWKPVEKKEGFNPLGRWESWSPAQHERFNWIAGGYLAEWRYEKKSGDGNPALMLLKDGGWQMRKALRAFRGIFKKP